jgi:hypothetical protein
LVVQEATANNARNAKRQMVALFMLML